MDKRRTVSFPTEYVHYDKGDLVFATGIGSNLDSERVYEVESFEPPTEPNSKGKIKLYGRYSTIEAEVFPVDKDSINYMSHGNEERRRFFQDQIDKIKRTHENTHNH